MTPETCRSARLLAVLTAAPLTLAALAANPTAVGAAGSERCPAVVVDDSYTTVQEVQLSVESPAEGVLANDSGRCGVPTLTTEPLHGSLSLHADGTFLYTPDSGFAGTDEFEYSVGTRTSGAGSPSSVGHVTIEVTSCPQTGVDDAYSVSAGSILRVAAPDNGVLANDVICEADGVPDHAVLLERPTSGSVTLQRDGTFEYSPVPGFRGFDQFTYFVGEEPSHDGARIASSSRGADGSAMATVVIHVS